MITIALACHWWWFLLMCFLADGPGPDWRRQPVHRASGPDPGFFFWLRTQTDPTKAFFLRQIYFCRRQPPQILPNHPRWEGQWAESSGFERVKCGTQIYRSMQVENMVSFCGLFPLRCPGTYRHCHSACFISQAIVSSASFWRMNLCQNTWCSNYAPLYGQSHFLLLFLAIGKRYKSRLAMCVFVFPSGLLEIQESSTS